VRRGEIFRFRVPRDRRGREQRGHRYCVVLQAGDLLALSTVIVAPTSTKALAASFRPEIELAGARTRVLVEQLGAVDQSRLGSSAGMLSWQELAELDRAIQRVLGLAA
jgi:mRNA interferase MazF